MSGMNPNNFVLQRPFFVLFYAVYSYSFALRTTSNRQSIWSDSHFLPDSLPFPAEPSSHLE